MNKNTVTVTTQDVVEPTPSRAARDAHEKWFAAKVLAGWVTGPVDDPDAMPPTCALLVGFDDLPPEEQELEAIRARP